MEWRLFANLATLAGTRRTEVDVARDASVADAVDALVDDQPDLREAVLDDDGDLAGHVTVLVDGEAVEDLDAGLQGADELALCPPASGG
ncbi:MAG: ubiquitin-like small modifier protein 1 [Halobacteriaceae archaeon]